jgi:hypothetical protein
VVCEQDVWFGPFSMAPGVYESCNILSVSQKA